MTTPDGIAWKAHEVATSIITQTEASIDWETGEVDEFKFSQLDLLNLDFERVVGASGSAYRQLVAKASAYKDESQYYRDKALTLERAAERLKESIKQEMDRLGITKIDGPFGGATIQKSTPKVVIIGEVPDHFLRQPPPEIDKARLRKYLDTNKETWAKLQRSTHLRFR